MTASSTDATSRVSAVDHLLDRLAERLGAERWVVCWRDRVAWQVRSSSPSLADDVLVRHAGDIASGVGPRVAHLQVASLGDPGARLAAAGVERVSVLRAGEAAVAYLEDPDPDAADAFEADPGGLADLDIAGMLLAERLARDLSALADWVPALEDVAAGRETPAAATARLGELAECDLVLDDATTVEARPGAPRRPSRELLRAASSLLAVATAGTRDAGQSRRDALLRERARIGSVIHEGITQVLTNVAIQLEVLDHVLDDPEQARSMIRTSREAVLEALDSLRSIIFDLTPTSEEWSDLVGGLERFVADFSAQWGLSVALDVSGEPREVDAEVTSLAFAFVQEGLTNARKHAKTEAATVRLAFAQGRLAVEIADDGIGIDPQAHEERSLRQHQGLKIMESRVRLMDGTFQLESVPGGGTNVRMEIPA